ncbi:MAG: putative heat shock protein HspR [Actinobacteria bacterium]|nr:putative heat shock protein HspR [Actinomycetota bacterium]
MKERRERRKAVYAISIAAELAHCHPQTLRLYERKGLLCPLRTSTNIRLYSEDDLEKLRLIHTLTQEDGVNLAGVKRILEMREALEEIRAALAARENEMERMSQEMREEIEKVRRSYKKEIAILPSREILKYFR